MHAHIVYLKEFFLQIEFSLDEPSQVDLDIMMQIINGFERKTIVSSLNFSKSQKFPFSDNKVRPDSMNRFHIGTAFLPNSEKKADASGQQHEEEAEILEIPSAPNINNLFDDDSNEKSNESECNQNDSKLETIEETKIISTNEEITESKKNWIQTTNEELAKLESSSVTAKPAINRHCEICDVSVTSDVHMQLHLNGAKHAKKLRQLGAPPYTPVQDTLSQCFMANYEQNQNKKSSKSIDYSVYRTPSGQYYCLVCNITVTSEVLLDQHFGSKKHLRTASLAKKK